MKIFITICLLAALGMSSAALAATTNVGQVNEYIKQKYPNTDVGGRVMIADPTAFVSYITERYGKPAMVGSGKDKTSYGWLVKIKNDSFGNCIEINFNPKKSAQDQTYPLQVSSTKCEQQRLQRLGYKITGEMDNVIK
jgi:hypothetical protein